MDNTNHNHNDKNNNTNKINNNYTNNSTNNNPSHFSSDSSAAETTATAGNNANNRDQFLRHLNKLSHKISKPSTQNPPPPNLPSSGTSNSSTFRKPPHEPPLPPPVHPPQQQPPVYNINKSDFRDVVQKLTGSPAHAAAAPAPPPIHAPKSASSRLQRIRPPPLAQLSPRPPSMLSCGVNPHSPLPPLPTCHAAAESPISAYMRFLHSSVDSSFNRTGQMLPPPSPPPADFTTVLPPFGFLPSPKSPCPFVPPNMMFSPTGNSPLGFPFSPTVPGVPSPK